MTRCKRSITLARKKRHTLKTELIVTKKGRIASVSPSHPGSDHDLTVRREGPKLPKGARAYGDSAYQGYGNEHKAIDYPYKKPKDGELTEEEKEYNKGLSLTRPLRSSRITGLHH